MRSLFVDDIPGAKPKRHSFNKAIYRQRHQQQIVRHSKKNPQQRRVIEWYNPVKKPVQPLDRVDDDQFRTKLTLKKSFGSQVYDLSKSMQMSHIRSQSAMEQNQMTKSNILSGTGKKSLNTSLNNVQDPYFPHRYTDKVVGQVNKWSGSRMWQHEATKLINLPSVKDSYFKRW